MDAGLVVRGAVFGLAASMSCVGSCMPVMVPFITGRRSDAASGMSAAALLSIGRLAMYTVMALLIWGGSSVMISRLDDGGYRVESGMRVLVAAMGAVIVVYAVLALRGFRGPHWCPARAQTPVMAVVLGLVVGAAMCPWLFMILVDGIAAGDLASTIAAVLAFWSFSSIGIITAGGLAGYIGKRWQSKSGMANVRAVSLMVLILVGIYYMFMAAVMR